MTAGAARSLTEQDVVDRDLAAAPTSAETEEPFDARAPSETISLLDRLMPAFAGVAFLLVWEGAVRWWAVSKFILPPPSLIITTMVLQWSDLFRALRFTAVVTLTAFALALISGIALGMLLTMNRRIERTFWPYAVIMQVTPVVSIAPLIIIWVGLDRAWLALLILAWMVAFFPMLSNTALGMKSADHGLRNVFELYGASRWKRLRYLQLPAALPYILAGARISSGLSVIGAVVAEFVAGSGSATGLAYTIIESGSMLNIPRMFAALFLLSGFGLTIWYITSLVQRLLLRRWHESELRHEN